MGGLVVVDNRVVVLLLLAWLGSADVAVTAFSLEVCCCSCGSVVVVVASDDDDEAVLSSSSLTIRDVDFASFSGVTLSFSNVAFATMVTALLCLLLLLLVLTVAAGLGSRNDDGVAGGAPVGVGVGIVRVSAGVLLLERNKGIAMVSSGKGRTGT